MPKIFYQPSLRLILKASLIQLYQRNGKTKKVCSTYGRPTHLISYFHKFTGAGPIKKEKRKKKSKRRRKGESKEERKAGGNYSSLGVMRLQKKYEA